MKKLFIISSLALLCLAFTNSPTAIGKTATFNDAIVMDCLIDDAYANNSGALGCKVLLMTCSPNTESLDQLERLKVLTGYDSANFTKFDSN